MAAMADTSTSTLSVYVGLHCAIVPVVMNSGVLKPSHVMVSEGESSWIPMYSDPREALERAKWGAEELGLKVGNPKQYLVLLYAEFSALGFTHYFLRNVLSTRDRRAWRFQGELVVPRAVNTDGENLTTGLTDRETSRVLSSQICGERKA